MTTSSLMAHPHDPPPPQVEELEGPGRSMLAMPTHEIKLSPEFVDALKQVAPKPRKRVLPYVLALAVVVAGVSLAAVPEARHRIASAWHRAVHGELAAPSVVPSTSAPVPTVSAS
ncbi:MAG TPA: hypothetical protein VF765_04700, partial [Polyangiaceae bacterium]